jgi:hypothetical protein
MKSRQAQQDGVSLCQTEQERQFVEALLLHCRQKWQESPGGPIRMTHDQAKEIIRVRHGIDLDPQQFQRLKRKFVTSLPAEVGKVVRPAERFELLREVKKGYLGVPSESEVTGLLPVVLPSNGDTP